MDSPDDSKVEIVLRCIYPNLNWKPEDGPDYNLTTLIEEFRARVKKPILCKSQFFRSTIEKKKTSSQAIEIKLTSRKNQVSINSILQCLDFLDNQDQSLITITPKTMLSFLVTSNFLKIPELEALALDYIQTHISSKSIVPIAQIALQTKDKALLDKSYYFIRSIILSRLDNFKLPDSIQDHKSLILSFPFLQYKSFKIDLSLFAYKSSELYTECKLFHEVTPSYNLMRIERTRSEESITGNDYPHTFTFIREHDQAKLLYAERYSDSGNFIICRKGNLQYGEDYVGVITNNFWGHEFSVFDDGVDEKVFKQLPTGFVKQRERKMFVKFETNILGECPRALTVDFWNEEEKANMRIKNLPPKWNEGKECYTLNFYGRVSRASAKNFQMVAPGDDDTIYLLFGKFSTECFHLDYRSPLSMFQAFAIGLTALARKRVVS